MAAPLPRAWQWLDGSAFPSHGELMQKAFNLPPIATDLPLMYQGMSHQFLGTHGRCAVHHANRTILISRVSSASLPAKFPWGLQRGEVLGRIRLAVQINDWSLRAIAPVEMKTGFGWIQAKPACSMAPVAVTLDELGDDWAEGRILATTGCEARAARNLAQFRPRRWPSGFTNSLRMRRDRADCAPAPSLARARSLRVHFKRRAPAVSRSAGPSR